MKTNKTYFVLAVLGLSFLLIVACKNSTDDTETILTGQAAILVDESIFPIVEDQQAVFETQYQAKLTLMKKSESEIVNALLNASIKIAVLPRKLSNAENNLLSNKKINPKQTLFAKDAVVFITNKASNDTLISLEDVVSFLNGKEVKGIKGLVFDNPNSSSVRLLSEKVGVKIASQKNVFSFATNIEVIKYVAENEGMIGVIGINWLYQPPLIMQATVDKVQLMSVQADKDKGYIYPSQLNIGKGFYPLARHLYIINCQGYSGLGMGFASFIGGERGQRIVLKSGLVPVRYPSRNIITRKNILNEKK